MAKLPKIDVEAIWIRDLLNRGKGHRQEAKARADAAVASGKAGEETKQLAEELATPKRGRPPYGAKHRWVKIGQRNDELLAEGKSYDERLVMLSDEFRLDQGSESKSELKAALAKYERGIEIIRADREKYRGNILTD